MDCEKCKGWRYLAVGETTTTLDLIEPRIEFLMSPGIEIQGFVLQHCPICNPDGERDTGYGCPHIDDDRILGNVPEGSLIKANPAYWGDMIHENEDVIFKVIGYVPSGFYDDGYAVVLEQISGPSNDIIGPYLSPDHPEYEEGVDDEENASPRHGVAETEAGSEYYQAFIMVKENHNG